MKNSSSSSSIQHWAACSRKLSEFGVRRSAFSALVPLLLAAALFLPACSTVSSLYHGATTTVSAPTSSTILVTTEKTTSIVRDAMNTFLKVERTNEAAFKQISPKPHEYAEYLRAPVPDDPPGTTIPRGMKFIKSARKASRAFKANRTPENEANLWTAYKTLTAVKAEIQGYLTMVKSTP